MRPVVPRFPPPGPSRLLLNQMQGVARWNHSSRRADTESRASRLCPPPNSCPEPSQRLRFCLLLLLAELPNGAISAWAFHPRLVHVETLLGVRHGFEIVASCSIVRQQQAEEHSTAGDLCGIGRQPSGGHFFVLTRGGSWGGHPLSERLPCCKRAEFEYQQVWEHSLPPSTRGRIVLRRNSAAAKYEHGGRRSRLS